MTALGPPALVARADGRVEAAKAVPAPLMAPRLQGEVVAGSTLEKSLYAVALVLFVITLVMNLISQMVLSRYREVYQ